MNFNELNSELNKDEYFLHEWLQDAYSKNIYYYWKNKNKGYKLDTRLNVVENIIDYDSYEYNKIITSKLMIENLNKKLAKNIVNKDFDYDDNLFENWLVDKRDPNKYYYWKGINKGYMFVVESKPNKLPRIKETCILNKDYLNPNLMEEFKDYKIKRVLNKELKHIKENNNKIENKILRHWTQDINEDNVYYYWKSRNEGYRAIIESNPLPEIKQFDLVDNEYFEPWTLKNVDNIKIKKILNKKIDD